LLVLLAPLASYTTLKTKNSAASPAMNPFAVANTGKKHNKVKGSCIALKIANQHLVLSTKKYSYRMQKKTGKSMILCTAAGKKALHILEHSEKNQAPFIHCRVSYAWLTQCIS